MILTRRFPTNLLGYLGPLGRRAGQKNTLHTEIAKLGRLLKAQPGAVPTITSMMPVRGET